MNEWLKILVSLSIAGTLIGGIILIIQVIMKDRLSKSWQYYVLLVVVLRMLIPINVDDSLFDKVNSKRNQETSTPEQVYYESGYSDGHSELFPDIKFDWENAIFDDLVDSTDRDEGNQSDKESHFTRNEILGFIQNQQVYIWVLIMMLFLVRKLTSYFNYVRYIKAGCSEIYDERVISIYMDVCSEYKLKYHVPIYINSMNSSAALVGVFRRFIILPNIELSDEELYYIFKHELTHHKRHDIIYKWVLQITVCIHWFNPFVYYLIKRHDQLCELSCDERVIKNLEEHEIKEYGDTLLSTIRINGTSTETITSVSLNKEGKDIKERLVSIMKFNKKNKAKFATTFVLTLSLVCGAVFVGVYEKPVELHADVNQENKLDEEFQKRVKGFDDYIKKLEDEIEKAIEKAIEKEIENIMEMEKEYVNSYIETVNRTQFHVLDISVADKEDALSKGWVEKDGYYCYFSGPYYADEGNQIYFNLKNGVEGDFMIGTSQTADIGRYKIKGRQSTIVQNNMCDKNTDNSYYVYIALKDIKQLQAEVYIPFSNKNAGLENVVQYKEMQNRSFNIE